MGFGLFPFAAMLNHSCDPNCAFAGAAGGGLTIRAIRPAAAGEELCFGYIDLFQARARGQFGQGPNQMGASVCTSMS